MLTVKDLRELLRNVPGDIPIVRMGHFGEPHNFDSDDFRFTDAIRPLTDHVGGWPSGDYIRGGDVEPYVVLAIEPPYIGPDPD